MISGTGIAFAGSPTAPAPAPAPNHGSFVSGAAKDDLTTGKAHGSAVSKVAQGNQGKPTTEGSEAKGTESEGAVDAAAQLAACQAAGITDTNVQYDDVTGACSLDTGGTDSTTKAGEKGTAETAPEGSEAKGTEPDVAAGHEDTAGQDVDHQFDGEE